VLSCLSLNHLPARSCPFSTLCAGKREENSPYKNPNEIYKFTNLPICESAANGFLTLTSSLDAAASAGFSN
jgi:hypothetical protein